jgi:hypothetical protein
MQPQAPCKHTLLTICNATCMLHLPAVMHPKDCCFLVMPSSTADAALLYLIALL